MKYVAGIVVAGLMLLAFVVSIRSLNGLAQQLADRSVVESISREFLAPLARGPYQLIEVAEAGNFYLVGFRDSTEKTLVVRIAKEEGKLAIEKADEIIQGSYVPVRLPAPRS